MTGLKYSRGRRFGKTRLALEIARGLRRLLPGWSVARGARVDSQKESWYPRRWPTPWGCASSRTARSPTRLADALRQKMMLLLLDNCEHLLDAAARLVDALLGSCPRLADTGHQPGGYGRPRRSSSAGASPHRYPKPTVRPRPRSRATRQ